MTEILKKCSAIFLIVGVIFATFSNAVPQSNNLAMQNAMRGLDSARFKPNFNINAAGSGNNGRNWGAGVNAGLGTKVWENSNRRHQVGVGVNYGRQFGKYNGQSWASKPDIGVGAGYRFNFGK